MELQISVTFYTWIHLDYRNEVEAQLYLGNSSLHHFRLRPCSQSDHHISNWSGYSDHQHTGTSLLHNYKIFHHKYQQYFSLVYGLYRKWHWVSSLPSWQSMFPSHLEDKAIHFSSFTHWKVDSFTHLMKRRTLMIIWVHRLNLVLLTRHKQYCWKTP